MMLSSVVEQSFYIPDILTTTLAFRITIGLWYLLNIIFTNSYKGIVINGLTAPPPASSVRHFKELSTYENPWTNSSFKKLRKYNPSSDFRVFSSPFAEVPSFNIPPQKRTALDEAIRLFYFSSRHSPPTEKEEIDLKLYTEDQRNLMPRIYSIEISYESAVEYEIIQCNRNKTVFADFEDVVVRERDYIEKHYHQFQFTTSKDVILHSSMSWTFQSSELLSMVPKYFKMLVQSGIYHEIERFVYKNDYRKRFVYTKNATAEDGKLERVQPLKLGDSIQTTIYLLAFGIALGIMWLFMELLYTNKVFVKDVLKK